MASSPADTQFICTSRTALPELVEEVRRLRYLILNIYNCMPNGEVDEAIRLCEKELGSLAHYIWHEIQSTTPPKGRDALEAEGTE